MIELPPSKSIGARYMVATYFAGTLPSDPLFEDNDDLMVLQDALLEVYSDEEPIDYGDSPIDVGASGTALRFVTAVCASSPGADYIVTGTPRLMERPMEPMVNLLKEAGAEIEALGENFTGPYRVKGNRLKGGEFSIPGNISSQFISALMLVAPSWEKGIYLNFTTPVVSRPYLEMTAGVMKKFNIEVNLDDDHVEVKPGRYVEKGEFQVEPDWSAASFFYEACAISSETIIMKDLVSPYNSLQGDSIAMSLFTLLGVESEFNKEGATIYRRGHTDSKVEYDFGNCPDLVLPFAVACLCNNVHFHFHNVAHLRLKESDRLESLKEEAGKLGFVIKTDEDSLEWNGEMMEKEENPVIDPHDDHRVAMAFAMVALKYGEVRISNPRVVEKSFINFWNQIPDLGLSCLEENSVMTVKYSRISH